MKIIYILFIALGLSTQLTAQKTEVEWLEFDELEEKYRMKPKPMLLFLYTDWCKYCKIQENTTFKDEEIIKRLNEDVYPVRFNAESKEEFIFFGRKYSFSEENGFHSLAIYLGGEEKLEFPTTIILDKMMEPVFRKSALISKEEMLKILP